MIRRFYFFILLIILSQTVFSQEEIDPSLLEIEKKTWNLGINRFTGINLEKKNEYLLFSLPLLLLDDLSDITTHSVKENEKESYTSKYIQDQIVKIRKEKSQLHKQRDSLLFSETEQNERSTKYASLTKEISQKDSLIGKWTALDQNEIHMNDQIPLLIKKYTDEKDKLGQSWFEKSDFMEKEDLDLLLSGSVEKLDDLFLLNIQCYSKLSESPVLEFQKSGTEDELNNLLMESSDYFRTEILGRLWSTLNIKSTPDNAFIILDGETVGVGNFHSKTLNPGFMTLSVRSAGFKTYSSQVYLASGSDQSREIILEPGEAQSISIYSEPPDADVYLGALWVGKTPMEINKPAELELLKVTKENFMPFILPLDNLTSDNITIRLDSNLYEKKKRLNETKSAFYRSLGWFTLSLGIPLVLSGIYQNLDNRYYKYAVDYNTTTNPDSYDKAIYYKKYADISYYCLWGGVAVSSSLFINSLIKLRNYIIAAEKSTED